MATVVGDNIRKHRERLGWTQERLAREACKAAGLPPGALTNQRIYRYEKGQRTPREWLAPIAQALRVSVHELTTCYEDEPESPTRAPLHTLHKASGAQLAPTIRELNRRLIALDNELHGLPIAETAARAFKTVYRRLGQGNINSRYEKDVQASAAELAEIAGWALFNEGRPKESRRFSQEALLLARTAGDKGIELLTLQNVALVGKFIGRPREELTIAQSVLEREQLNPRVEAMFRSREGQGLSRAHSPNGEKSFARARSLLQECPPVDAPEWAWWVSEREIDRQQGRALCDIGHWSDAIPVLQRATDDRNDEAHVGYSLSSSFLLLNALMAVEAWGDALEVAERLIPEIGEVASVATLKELDEALARNMRKAPPDLREAVHQLRLERDADPFEF